MTPDGLLIKFTSQVAGMRWSCSGEVVHKALEGGEMNLNWWWGGMRTLGTWCNGVQPVTQTWWYVSPSRTSWHVQVSLRDHDHLWSMKNQWTDIGAWRLYNHIIINILILAFKTLILVNGHAEENNNTSTAENRQDVSICFNSFQSTVPGHWWLIFIFVFIHFF